MKFGMCKSSTDSWQETTEAALKANVSGDQGPLPLQGWWKSGSDSFPVGQGYHIISFQFADCSKEFGYLTWKKVTSLHTGIRWIQHWHQSNNYGS